MSIVVPPPFPERPIEFRNEQSFPIRLGPSSRASENPTRAVSQAQPIQQPQRYGERTSDLAKVLYGMAACASSILAIVFVGCGLNAQIGIAVSTLLLAGYVFCRAMDGATKS